jgi:hypothetical protein
MKRLLHIAVIAALPFAVVSCASQGNLRATDNVSYAGFKSGVTTKKEIHAALGQPHDVRRQSDSSRWTYYHTTIAMNGLGLIPFAGLFLPGQNTTYQVAHVHFDKREKYRSVETKGGGEMQNSFKALGRSADSFSNDRQHMHVHEEMTRLGLPFDTKEATKVKDMGTILGANPNL